MQANLKRIMELQPQWTHKNNEPMAERGSLVRHACVRWLRSFDGEMAAALGIELSDLIIEGSDGVGPKAELPWFRFADIRRSPSATKDWYCVYLFDTTGECAFLSLAHGSTDIVRDEFKPRPQNELRALAEWGREQATVPGEELSKLLTAIDLKARSTKLGPAYEAGTALAIRYDAAAIPGEALLKEDALKFAALLRQLYEAALPSDEVLEAHQSSSDAAGRSSRVRGGQGFGLNKTQKSAVEERAMLLARELLEGLGWQCHDESRNKSYDYRCIRDGEEILVEVKGTTSPGQSVVLTVKEAELHSARFPRNALIVVSNIVLTGADRDVAEGGDTRLFAPWALDAGRLRPISYTYAVPVTDAESAVLPQEPSTHQ